MSAGTHKPAEALHQQIAEPQPTALGYADSISAGLSYTAPHILALAADELRAQHARIAQLEAQLEAIGAGGVEPLRKQPAQGVEKDAARYRFLRDGDWRENDDVAPFIHLQLNALWDEKIDAALAAHSIKD